VSIDCTSCCCAVGCRGGCYRTSAWCCSLENALSCTEHDPAAFQRQRIRCRFCEICEVKVTNELSLEPNLRAPSVSPTRLVLQPQTASGGSHHRAAARVTTWPKKKPKSCTDAVPVGTSLSRRVYTLSHRLRHISRYIYIYIYIYVQADAIGRHLRKHTYAAAIHASDLSQAPSAR
jgi:hypothetical protein